MKKDPQPLTPAALYARVSSDRQDVDLSVTAQLKALRDYAKANGHSVAREYVDEAESGRITDRPQFRKMIEEGGRQNAPFQVILVWKFSRFTRKREHAVAFKSMLRRKGIRVVSITEHADDSPTGKLMEAIIESLDEFYSENLAQEVTRGMREAASRGFFLGSKAPFGYTRVKVNDGVKERPTLEVDPGTAPIVKEIFESSLRGNGLKEICRSLNDRGVTNKGRRWHKNGLHYVLTNEAYTGTAVWGRTTKAEPAADPVRVEGAWEPLVSGELFGKVQQALRERAPAAQRPGSGRQQVPAERLAALRSLRQALHRPGRQERPVRLLRLRHVAPGGRGNLQGPLPERPQDGGVHPRQDQGAHPHRRDHHRARDPGRRGDRRDGRGDEWEAAGDSGGDRGRGAQAGAALRSSGDEASNPGGPVAAHPLAASSPGPAHRGAGRGCRPARATARGVAHHRGDQGIRGGLPRLSAGGHVPGAQGPHP